MFIKKLSDDKDLWQVSSSDSEGAKFDIKSISIWIFFYVFFYFKKSLKTRYIDRAILQTR